MPPKNLLIILVTVAVSFVCYSTAARNRYANLFSEAMDVVDTQALQEVPREQLFKAAMDGMLGQLDKYSKYIAGDSYQQFDEALSQQFGGLGMYVDVDSDSNSLVILATMPGTPAYDAGLTSGDRILEIDGETTGRLQRGEAIEVLRGPVGEPTSLLVRRGSETFNVDVQRQIIGVQSVHGDYRDDNGDWVFRLEGNPAIGYVRLRQFGEQTVTELEAALRSMNGEVDSIILDLRHNSGGLLTSAIDVCDMFLEEGKMIVSTQGRGRLKQEEHSSTERILVSSNVELIVLTNRYSASASEIVAGCLQDHKRAILIGEQTWGKGTVQNVIPIRPNRSALKLTTASYWRPSGQPIDRYDSESKSSGIWGVRPDPKFVVAIPEDYIWRNFQKRNMRDIETLIPQSLRSELRPLLLSRPMISTRPKNEVGDREGPSEDIGDQDIGDEIPPQKPPNWLEWNDDVMERALKYLQPRVRSNAA